jgi:hypothetical protein
MPEYTRVIGSTIFQKFKGNSSAICGVLDGLNVLLATEASSSTGITFFAEWWEGGGS